MEFLVSSNKLQENSRNLMSSPPPTPPPPLPLPPPPPFSLEYVGVVAHLNSRPIHKPCIDVCMPIDHVCMPMTIHANYTYMHYAHMYVCMYVCMYICMYAGVV